MTIWDAPPLQLHEPIALTRDEVIMYRLCRDSHLPRWDSLRHAWPQLVLRESRVLITNDCWSSSTERLHRSSDSIGGYRTRWISTRLKRNLNSYSEPQAPKAIISKRPIRNKRRTDEKILGAVSPSERVRFLPTAFGENWRRLTRFSKRVRSRHTWGSDHQFVAQLKLNHRLRYPWAAYVLSCNSYPNTSKNRN